MNERIKQLAFEANKDLDGNVPIGFAEKFAELIVKECLAKAEEEEELYRGFSHLGGAEYAKVMYNYQLLLKEHFGVEE
jgi:hypothetical protein